MAGFGNEVVNLGKIPRGVMPPPGCPPTGWLTPNVYDDVVLVNTNATNLRRVSSRLHADGGGMIIIPPGRFYLGVPQERPDYRSSEANADIILSDRIRLYFMPGGQLIPIRLGPNDPGYRMLPWMRTGDPYLVRLEIMSSIDADIRPIFDAFVDDPSRDDERVPTREAGLVFFTRQQVREVFPEWWGAVSSDVLPQPPTPGQVRRTTKAMQACFDAAHRAMLEPKQNGSGHYPGVLVDRVRPSIEAPWSSSTAGLDARRATWRDGRIFLDGASSPLSMPVTRTPLRHFDLDLGQQRRSSSVAPIPVTLHGVYEVDDEVTVGFTVQEAESEAPPSAMQPPSHDVFVLRGARSTADGSVDGMARLVASAHLGSAFARESSAWGSAQATKANAKLPDGRAPAVYARRALLGVRGPVGVTVRDVGFDANYTAARCVTLADFLGGQHGPSFTGCGFRNARTELVHLGGELRNVVPARGGGAAAYVPGNAPQWKGGGDLSGLVFDRCRFETDSASILLARADRIARRSRNSIGVVFRAGQSFAVACHACTFRGPANPMILALSGRLSLSGCSFESWEVVGEASLARVGAESGSTNGADVFLELPLRETQVVPKPPNAPALVAQTITCLTVRGVASRSAQFLVSSADSTTPVTAAQAAVVISGLRHEPSIPTTRPSVYWGGNARKEIPFVMFASALRGGDTRGALELGASGAAGTPDVVLVGVEGRASSPLLAPAHLTTSHLRVLR